jgi:4-hydroxy 2-oxovalerate aldolase
MIVLDCTFRDGGYYTDWNFDIKLVNAYLKAIEKSKIEAVEIGFRSSINKMKGTYSHITDDFIFRMLEKPNVKYFGVMVNTSECTNESIKNNFSYIDKSQINMVRLATHFKDTSMAESFCKDLKNLGYFVCVNLMQAADKSFDEIAETAKKIEEWKSVDVLYLADSLGGMNQDSVNYAFRAIKEGWSGLVGFHGHNNKSQALDNSLEAVDMGVDFIDCTMLGMGRGPGNTEIEYLIGELNKRGFGEYNTEPIYEFVLEYFYPMKRQYDWGPSLLYFLSAEYNIHPTYVQTMLLEDTPLVEILRVINILKDRKSTSFKKEILDEVKK